MNVQTCNTQLRLIVFSLTGLFCFDFLFCWQRFDNANGSATIHAFLSIFGATFCANISKSLSDILTKFLNPETSSGCKEIAMYVCKEIVVSTPITRPRVVAQFHIFLNKNVTCRVRTGRTILSGGDFLMDVTVSRSFDHEALSSYVLNRARVDTRAYTDLAARSDLLVAY